MTDRPCGRCQGTGRLPLNATEQETLAAMNRPVTVKEAAASLGISTNAVQIRLERMRNEGLVTRTTQSGKRGALYVAR